MTRQRNQNETTGATLAASQIAASIVKAINALEIDTMG